MKQILITLLFLPVLLLSQSNVDNMKNLYSSGKLYEASQLADAVSNESPKDFNVQVMCGDVFSELGNNEKALEFYRKAFKIDDDDYMLITKLAKTLHLTGNKEESFKYFDEALDEADDDEQLTVYLEYANAYIRDNNTNEARNLIDRAKNIDDENPAVYIALGDMYYAQGIYELSKKEYLEALKYDDQNVEARSNLATSYYWLAQRTYDDDLRKEYFVQCLKEWDEVTKKDPNNAKAFFEEGKILFWSSRFADAAPKLNRSVQLNPSNKLGRWFLAQSLVELGKCDSASQHLSWSAENIDTVRVKSKVLLAECFFQNKEYQKVVNTYEEVLADTTLSLKDMKIYGNASVLVGDTVKALQIWDETIAMKPDASCGLMMVIGQLYFVKKDYNNATKYFEMKLNTEGCQDDKEKKATYFIGLSSLFGGIAKGVDEETKTASLNKAEEYLSKAYQMDTTDLQPLNYLADVYANKGDEQKSVDTYLTVLEKSSNDPEANAKLINQAYIKICGLYYDKKDWPNLIQYGTQWSEADPKSEYAPFYVGLAYHNKFATGEGDNFRVKACDWYKKTLAINPKNDKASQLIGDLGCE